MLTDDYLSYITAVRRYSPRTQAIYREVLDRFSEFSGGAVLESLTPSLIGSYVAGMIAAAVFGYISIRIVGQVVLNRKMRIFAYYCFGVGLFSIAGQFIFMK